MSKSSKEQVVLSIVGKNRIGILAELTATIAENDVNILDISQKLMGDYFCTLMMVEIQESGKFSILKESLENLGSQRGDYKVMVQHEKVFQVMHRV